MSQWRCFGKPPRVSHFADAWNPSGIQGKKHQETNCYHLSCWCTCSPCSLLPSNGLSGLFMSARESSWVSWVLTRVDQCHCAWPIPAGFMPMNKREGHHKSSSSYWKGSGPICVAKCQVLVYSTANLTMHKNELTTMPLAGDQQRRIEAVLICFYVVSGQRVKHA